MGMVLSGPFALEESTPNGLFVRTILESIRFLWFEIDNIQYQIVIVRQNYLRIILLEWIYLSQREAFMNLRSIGTCIGSKVITNSILRRCQHDDFLAFLGMQSMTLLLFFKTRYIWVLLIHYQDRTLLPLLWRILWR